jgi:GH18 family chitinase
MKFILFTLLLLELVNSRRIIGFFQSSSIYTGFSFDSIDPRKYNVLKYSFVNIDKDTASCFIGDKYGDIEMNYVNDDKNCKW